MKKRALVFALAGVLAVSSLTGCGSSFDGDAVAIKVGDAEVTADVANFYARYTQAQYETYYGAYLGEEMWSSDASEGVDYEEFVKSGLQESLETMILSEQHMDEYNVVLTDEEKEIVAKAVKEFSEANTLDNKEYVSGDDETVERVMTLLAIQKKVQNAISKGADTEVSDDEAAQKSMQYVRFAFIKTDEEGESVTLTDDEKAAIQKDAESFAKEAKEAEDFAKLAEEKEVTAETATFDAESTTFDTAVIETADKMKKNEVSDVIVTDNACYVLKLTSLMDRQATEDKKEQIVSERQSELYSEVTAQWIEEADIEVNEEVWESIDFNSMTISMVTDESEPYADEVQTDDVAE